MEAFQPFDVFRIVGPIFRAERPELYEVKLIQPCQFIENPLCRLVQVFVIVNQTARQFHVIIVAAFFVAGLLYEKHFEMFAVKT